MDNPLLKTSIDNLKSEWKEAHTITDVDETLDYFEQLGDEKKVRVCIIIFRIRI